MQEQTPISHCHSSLHITMTTKFELFYFCQTDISVSVRFKIPQAVVRSQSAFMTRNVISLLILKQKCSGQETFRAGYY